MRKFYKRISCALLLAVLLCMMVSGTASAAIKYTKSQTLYLGGKGQNAWNYGYIYVDNLAPDEMIAKNSVRSNSSIISNISVYRYGSIYKREYIWSPYYKWDDSEEYNNNASIDFLINRPGMVKISFKVGKKTYTSTVKVLSYTNPLAKVTISGVRSGNGENLAPWLKNSSRVAFRMAKTQNNVKVSAVAAKNWKITEMYYWSDNNTKNCNTSCYRTSAELALGRIGAKSKGSIQITLKNVKTGGTVTCSYSLV